MLWSDTRIEEVKTLAGQGWSAGQIATHFGDVSRNAVVGIGHRKGFQFHGNGGGANNRAKAKIKPPTPVCEEPNVPEGGITLMELQPSSCRWPQGDPAHDSFRFCGKLHAGDGIPYCAHHCRIGYEPRNR